MATSIHRMELCWLNEPSSTACVDISPIQSSVKELVYSLAIVKHSWKRYMQLLFFLLAGEKSSTNSLLSTQNLSIISFKSLSFFLFFKWNKISTKSWATAAWKSATSSLQIKVWPAISSRKWNIIQVFRFYPAQYISLKFKCLTIKSIIALSV